MSKQEFELYYKLEKDYWWFRARRNILSIFLDKIESKETKTILEIGCGTGGNLNYLFNEFKYRIGLEYDDDAISFAKKRCLSNTKILKGDANNLNLPDESVDCIALLDVLYHKNIKNVDNVLLQVNKTLKKAGHLLITDGAYSFLQGTHSKSVDSARRFTKKELIAKLKKENFRIIKISYWGIAIFIILFIKRVIIETLFFNKKKSVKYDFVRCHFIETLLYNMVSGEKYILKNFSISFGASIAVLAQKKL